MKMNKRFIPYQVICIGEDCRLHDKCDNICILKSKLKKLISGCNYSRKGDCNYCSNKKKCVLIKPYSKELNKIEVKRINLESENKKLYGYISEWDEIERNLDKYGKDSVTDVIYFDRSRQQMIDRINDNKRLINAYLKLENKLVEDMLS